MDLRTWKRVLLQWVTECDFIEGRNYISLEQSDIEDFFSVYVQQAEAEAEVAQALRALQPLQAPPTAQPGHHPPPRPLTPLEAFVTETYPEFNLHFDGYGHLVTTDYMYIYTLLLHYTCVKRPSEFFHSICKKLPDITQTCIAAFFQQTMAQPRFSRECLRQAIVNVASVFCSTNAAQAPQRFTMDPLNVDVDAACAAEQAGPSSPAANTSPAPPASTPLHRHQQLVGGSVNDSGDLMLAPPTPKTELLEQRNKELLGLRAQLETERYEKNVLEEQIMENEHLINSLSKENQVKKRQLAKMKETAKNQEEDDAEMRKYVPNELDHLKRSLMKEISRQEVVIAELTDKLQDLRTEKDELDNKLKRSSGQLIVCMDSIRDLEQKVEDLQLSLASKNTTIDCLERDKTELQRCLDEARDDLHNRREVLNASGDLLECSISANTTPEQENLASSVIDKQLREKELENTMLAERIQSMEQLMQQLGTEVRRTLQKYSLHQQSDNQPDTPDTQTTDVLALAKTGLAILDRCLGEEIHKSKVLHEKCDVQSKLITSTQEKSKIIDTQSTEILRLNKKASELEEASVSLISRYEADLALVKSDYEEKLKSVRSTNQELSEKIASEGVHMGKMKEYINEKEQQYTQLGNELRSLIEKNKELEGRSKELQSKQEDIREKYDQCRGQLTDKTGSLQQLTEQLNAAELRIDKFQQLSNRLKFENKTLVDEVAEARTRNEEFQTQIASLTLEREQISALYQSRRLRNQAFLGQVKTGLATREGQLLQEFSDMETETIRRIRDIYESFESFTSQIAESLVVQLPKREARAADDGLDTEQEEVWRLELNQAMDMVIHAASEQKQHLQAIKNSRASAILRQNLGVESEDMNVLLDKCVVNLESMEQSRLAWETSKQQLEQELQDLRNQLKRNKVIEERKLELEKDFANLQVKSKQYEQENKNLSDLKSKLEDEKSIFEQNIADLEQRLQKQEKLLDELRNQSQEYELSNKDLLLLITGLKKTQNDLMKQLEVLKLQKQAAKELEVRHSHLQRRVEELSAELDAKNAKMACGIQEKEEALKELQREQEIKSALEKQYAELLINFKQSQQDEQTLQRLFEEFKATKNVDKLNSENMIASLKEQLQKHEKQMEEFKIQSDLLKEEKASMSAFVTDLQHQLTDKANHLKDAQKQIDSIKERDAQRSADREEKEGNLLKQLEDTKEKIDLLINEKEEAATENTKLKAKLKEATDQLNSLEQQADLLKKEKELVSNQITDIKKNKDELVNEKEVLIKDKDRLEETLSAVTQELREEKHLLEEEKLNNVQLRIDIRKQEQETRKVRGQVINESKRNEEMSALLTKCQVEAERLKTEVTQFKDQECKLRSDLNVTKDRLRNAEREHKVTIANIEDQLETAVSERADFDQRLQGLNQDKLVQEANNRRLKELLGEADQERKQLHHDIAQARRRLVEQADQICDLQQKLQEERDQDNQRLLDLQEQKAKLERELNGKRLDYEAMQLELEVKMRAIESQNSEFEERERDLLHRAEQLESELMESQKLVSNLQQQQQQQEPDVDLGATYSKPEGEPGNTLALDCRILEAKYREAKKDLALSDQKLKDHRLEMEGKLDKMKNKMRSLYTAEMTRMTEKQKRDANDHKTAMDALTAQNAKYEEHTRKLSNQIVRLNEKILEQKKEHAITSIKLRHLQAQLEPKSAIQEQKAKLEREQLESKSTVAVPSASAASVTDEWQPFKHPNAPSYNHLAMEDEEGEEFNNMYLTDLKLGRVPDVITAEELQYRNSLQPPHLRSTYAAQYDMSSQDEDYKDGPHSLDDSMSALLSSSANNGARKKSMGTHYKRPGLPTPSKNGGRLSFGSSEPPREILRECSDHNTGSSKTPARFKFLSSRFSVGSSGLPRDEPVRRRKQNLLTGIQIQRRRLLRHINDGAFCTSTPRKSRSYFDQQRLIRVSDAATPEEVKNLDPEDAEEQEQEDEGTPHLSNAALFAMTKGNTRRLTGQYNAVQQPRRKRRASLCLHGNIFAKSRPAGGLKISATAMMGKQFYQRQKLRRERVILFDRARQLEDVRLSGNGTYTKSVHNNNYSLHNRNDVSVAMARTFLVNAAGEQQPNASTTWQLRQQFENEHLANWLSAGHSSEWSNQPQIFEQLCQQTVSTAPFELQPIVYQLPLADSATASVSASGSASDITSVCCSTSTTQTNVTTTSSRQTCTVSAMPRVNFTYVQSTGSLPRSGVVRDQSLRAQYCRYLARLGPGQRLVAIFMLLILVLLCIQLVGKTKLSVCAMLACMLLLPLVMA
ncbi:hypothetical protein KR018_011782 [Drosophila ironensis]|nr:hypothetical protein KR018_011782 [Drosophila ironensis]